MLGLGLLHIALTEVNLDERDVVEASLRVPLVALCH